MQELEIIAKHKSFTRGLIRVKFPDDFMLQGTFAALERIEDIYAFVREHLAQPRDFYLFETPPKRVLKEQKKTISKANMMPSAILHFGWSDQDVTMDVDGPFLKQDTLRQYLVNS